MFYDPGHQWVRLDPHNVASGPILGSQSCEYKSRAIQRFLSTRAQSSKLACRNLHTTIACEDATSDDKQGSHMNVSPAFVQLHQIHPPVGGDPGFRTDWTRVDNVHDGN